MNYLEDKKNKSGLSSEEQKRLDKAREKLKSESSQSPQSNSNNQTNNTSSPENNQQQPNKTNYLPWLIGSIIVLGIAVLFLSILLYKHKNNNK